MTFRITGLDPDPFRPLYGLDDAALAARGAQRMTVDGRPGYPDRITLREAAPGTTVLLLNHESLPAGSPFHARHAIFVPEGADTACTVEDEIPEVMRQRVLSLRGFDAGGMMRDADLCDGSTLRALIARLFRDPDIVEIHAHNAARGCYCARITRA